MVQKMFYGKPRATDKRVYPETFNIGGQCNLKVDCLASNGTCTPQCSPTTFTKTFGKQGTLNVPYGYAYAPLDAADIGAAIADYVHKLPRKGRYRFRTLWGAAIAAAFGPGGLIGGSHLRIHDPPDLQKEFTRLKWAKGQWVSICKAETKMAETWLSAVGGYFFLKHTTLRVRSPSEFIMKYEAGGVLCSTRIRWMLCFCPGCNCKGGLSSMSVQNDMVNSTDATFCGGWHQKVDEAVRIYVASVRGVALSRKLMCCAPGKKMPHSDILCRDEDIKLEASTMQHKAAVFKAPKGWKDITESALKQTSLTQDVECKRPNPRTPLTLPDPHPLPDWQAPVCSRPHFTPYLVKILDKVR